MDGGELIDIGLYEQLRLLWGSCNQDIDDDNLLGSILRDRDPRVRECA